MNVQEKFAELDPGLKRKVVLGIIAVVVLMICWMYVSGDSTYQRKERGPEQPYIKSPLTHGASDSLGVEALAGRMANMQSDLTLQQNQLRNQQERYEADLARIRQNADREMAELNKKLREQKLQSEKERKALQATMSAAIEQARAESIAAGGTATYRVDPQNAENPETQAVYDSSQQTPSYMGGSPAEAASVIGEDWALFSDSADDALASEYDDENTEAAPSKIVTIGEVDKIFEEEKVEREEPKIYLPAGTIITGTLLSGMDAPTGNAGRSQPFPSLLRVEQEAILPNRGRFDISGCFLLAGGYGDLASERAYMRSEVISCRLSDGTIIESTLDAYATGEDGKTGVRGRLVNRMGSVLANSLLAGFAGAAAEIFTPKSVPVISSDTASSFLNGAQSGQAFQSGLGGGASSTLERLSDYYLSMAENTFPVVEIDATRTVSFILVRGTSLSDKGDTSVASGVSQIRDGVNTRDQAFIDTNSYTIP